MIRRRLNTFSSHEVHLFVSLLGGYVDVLFGPLSNQLTLNKKREAWEQLAQDLANNGFPLRTVHTLRKKWDNLMQETKKKHKFKMLHGAGRPVSWTGINERVMQIFRSTRYMTTNRMEQKVHVDQEINISFVDDHTIKNEMSSNFNGNLTSTMEENINSSNNFPQLPLLVESSSVVDKQSNYNSMHNENQSNKFEHSNSEVIEIDHNEEESSNSYSNQHLLSNEPNDASLISTNRHRALNYHKNPTRLRNFSFNPTFASGHRSQNLNSQHNIDYGANPNAQMFSLPSSTNHNSNDLKSPNLSEETSMRIELMRAQLESEKMRLSMYTTKKALLELQLRKELANT